MQDVHIICTWDQLQSMVAALQEQFEAQKEEVMYLIGVPRTRKKPDTSSSNGTMR